MNIYLITKLIAFITMCIDHYGSIASIRIFRIIGRISFPLFCMLIGYGARNMKKPEKKIIKLFITAIVSIPISMWFFEDKIINIIGGYFLFTLAIYVVKKLKLSTLSEVCIMILVASFMSVYNFDYAWLLVALCYLFYKCTNKYLVSFLFIIIEGLYVLYKCMFNVSPVIGLHALLAVPFILLFYFIIDHYKKNNIELKRHVYKNKFMNILASNIFYIMYPLHLIIIYYLYNYL